MNRYFSTLMTCSMAMSMVVTPFSGVAHAQTTIQVNPMHVSSLSIPLIKAVSALGELSGEKDSLFSQRAKKSEYKASIEEFGENLKRLAATMSAEITRELLAIALQEMKQADHARLLERQDIAQQLERDLNREIKRQARIFHPVLAVTSGIVVGTIVGFMVGASGIPDIAINPIMNRMSYNAAQKFGGYLAFSLLAATSAGGAAILYYVNEGANFDPGVIQSAVESALSADDELYNIR